jgi:hypothetical protein
LKTPRGEAPTTVTDGTQGVGRETCEFGANLQKSGKEGGVIAKMGGVKLQKSAGIFAIMSTTLHALCKVSEIGVARVSGNFFVKGDLDTFSPISALHHLPNHHPP